MVILPQIGLQRPWQQANPSICIQQIHCRIIPNDVIRGCSDTVARRKFCVPMNPERKSGCFMAMVTYQGAPTRRNKRMPLPSFADLSEAKSRRQIRKSRKIRPGSKKPIGPLVRVARLRRHTSRSNTFSAACYSPSSKKEGLHSKIGRACHL